MQTKNWHFYSNWFLGADAWMAARGPYYILPAIVWVSLEDLNLNVKGASVTFLFLNIAFQIQIKRWDRPIDDRKYQINDKNMELMLDELKHKHGWRADPDPAKIRAIVAKTAWLRQILAATGVQNAYTLNVLSSLLQQEKQTSSASELNFDLIDTK